MIEVQNVTLQIKGKTILSDANLTMEEGRIYGLVGNNGSGKTMLMKCICGFVLPTKGAVLSNGKKIGKDMDYLQDAGVIIETPGFLGSYSGYRNLKFLADIRNRIGKKEICEAIEMVGLDPKSRKHVRKYSLGMRQRLGLAQTFMEGQDILILDEPMNGLDNHGVADMRKLFLKLKEQGRTMLVASHNREDIDVLCDEVYEMDHGILTTERK